MRRKTRAVLMRPLNILNYFPILHQIVDAFSIRLVLYLALVASLMVAGTREMEGLFPDGLDWSAVAQTARFLGRDPFFVMVAVASIACSVAVPVVLAKLNRLGGLRFLRGGPGYERDDPAPGVHPVVISRLWNGCALADDVVVALLVLADKGLVALEEVSARDRKGRKVLDVSVDVAHGTSGGLTDPVDRCLYAFLKNRAAEEKGPFLVSSLFSARGSRKRARVNRAFIREFFGIARNQARSSGLFMDDLAGADDADEASRGQRIVLMAALLCPGLLLLGLLSKDSDGYFSLPVVRWLPFLPWAIYLALWVLFDMRRTPAGRRALARCRKLRRWLKDFTLLEDAGAAGVRVWGGYAVHAYALDVAERSMERMRVAGAQVDRTVMRAVEGEGWFSSASDKMDDYHRLIQGQNVVFSDEV